MWCYIFDYTCSSIYECYIENNVEDVEEYLREHHNLNTDNMMWIATQNKCEIQNIDKYE